MLVDASLYSHVRGMCSGEIIFWTSTKTQLKRAQKSIAIHEISKSPVEIVCD